MSDNNNLHMAKPPVLSNDVESPENDVKLLSLPRYPVQSASQDKVVYGGRGNHVANLKLLILNGTWISIVTSLVAIICAIAAGNEILKGYLEGLGFFLVFILAFAIVPFFIASVIWASTNALFMKLAITVTNDKKVSALGAAMATGLVCYFPVGYVIDFTVAFWIIAANFIGNVLLNISYTSTSIREEITHQNDNNANAVIVPNSTALDVSQALPSSFTRQTYSHTEEVKETTPQQDILPYTQENQDKKVSPPKPLASQSSVDIPKLAPATLSGITITKSDTKMRENSSWKEIIRSIFVKGALLNTVVSTSLTVLAAIPIAMLVYFMSAVSPSDTDGGGAEILFGAILSGIILGISWGVLNGVLLCLGLVFIKEKLVSIFLVPSILGITAFGILSFETFNTSQEVGASIGLFVYGGLGLLVIANVITSMVINKNSKVTITSSIFKKKQKKIA